MMDPMLGGLHDPLAACVDAWKAFTHLLSPIAHLLELVPWAGQLDTSWEEMPDSNIPAREGQAEVETVPGDRGDKQVGEILCSP